MFKLRLFYETILEWKRNNSNSFCVFLLSQILRGISLLCLLYQEFVTRIEDTLRLTHREIMLTEENPGHLLPLMQYKRISHKSQMWLLSRLSQQKIALLL